MYVVMEIFIIMTNTGPEIGIFLEPLMLSEKELVVLAINSNASLTDSGGTHW